MLSRALRVPRAVPLRAKLAAPSYIAARSVTTNAASASLSHSVPQVRKCALSYTRRPLDVEPLNTLSAIPHCKFCADSAIFPVRR
jgi:hypothetical protein